MSGEDTTPLAEISVSSDGVRRMNPYQTGVELEARNTNGIRVFNRLVRPQTT